MGATCSLIVWIYMDALMMLICICMTIAILLIMWMPQRAIISLINIQGVSKVPQVGVLKTVQKDLKNG